MSGHMRLILVCLCISRIHYNFYLGLGKYPKISRTRLQDEQGRGVADYKK